MENLSTVLFAVCKIALVVAISGFLVRRRIIPKEAIKPISSLVVTLFLPCLILYNILAKFTVDSNPDWWYIPLSSVIMTGAGLGLALIAPRRVLRERREIIPASFLQNAAFLVLPLAQSLLTGKALDDFTLTVFLFLPVYNSFLWLLGKHYMRKRTDNEPFAWKNILSTPFICSIGALFLVLTGLRDFVPQLVIDTTEFIGQGAIPVATFVLGATLGGLKIDFKLYWKDTVFVCFKKLIVIPALTILAMHFVPWLHSTVALALFFILQAAAPPATTLAIQSQAYNDNSERIASILFGSYLLSIVTIPLWILVMQTIYHPT